MSGPNPPEPGSGDEDPGVGQSAPEPTSEPAGDSVAGIDEAIAADPGPAPDNTAYSQAYSAPESEQFLSGPYVPVDPRLYDYDSYDAHDDSDLHAQAPRWPWVVGVAVIVAAVTLVATVGYLVASRTTDLHDQSADVTTSSRDLMPPVQDEITRTSTTTQPPPPPSSTTSEEPPPPVETSTTTEEPPPPVEAPAPEPSNTTSEPPTTTQAKPLQVTYSVTGTKAPFDQITITYVDPSGQRRTLRNAYIPWSVTVTPISLSEVGSVEATSMLRLSKLNCSITRSDGTVLSSNTNDAPAASCG